jgi:glutamine amidotransferase
MSSRLPTIVSSSLDEFSRHGGLDGRHADGWGVAWYDERDVRLVREPVAAASSVCVRFIREHPIQSQLVLGHVRHATQGELALRNTQPFCRELGGRMHVFAHNGDLPGARSSGSLRADTFRPVGETDSEHVFCALLEQLRPVWNCETPPAAEKRRELVADFAAEIRSLGPANFVYSDGELLFLHGDRRKHEPTESPRPPGLHVLERTCVPDASPFGTERPVQHVILAASVPLTDESWTPLAGGELVVARLGTRL